MRYEENVTGVFNISTFRPIFNRSESTFHHETRLGHTCDQQFYYPDFTQIYPVVAIFVFLYITTGLISILGNVLVIVTVWMNSRMHSKTNFYIVNLAASDLLVTLFVMPLKLVEYAGPCTWRVFSNYMCSAVAYLQPIFVFSSILTHMAISIER